MLKPVGSRCNMACQYCYYQEKGNALLSEQLLEEFTRQYLEAQFLHDNNFLVGISIDGPEHLNILRSYHASSHLSPHTSPPSSHTSHLSLHTPFHDIMGGIGLLNKHGVQWNAMATVNAANADHPVEFYRFFRDIGCQFLQFTPVVEKGERIEERGKRREDRGERKEECITPQQWGRFLCAVYDEWVKRDVGKIFVQLFDATLANWVGEPPGACSMAPTCGHAAVMEADGSVYSCDHFVFPEYRLGNIKKRTLTAMLYGERQLNFGRQKRDALPRQCRECEFLFACNGECPKNRFINDCYGEPGLNYLCEGYRQFFAHVAADMDFMAAELRVGRAPANIMT